MLNNFIDIYQYGTIKNLSLEEVGNYTPLYYQYFFEDLKKVDDIINYLFNNLTHTFYQDIILPISDYLEYSHNYSFSIIRLFRILNTVKERLIDELQVNSKNIYFYIVDNKSSIKAIIEILTVNQYYNENSYSIGVVDKNRKTGRSSNIICNLLQTAYNNWKRREIVPLKTVDHYAFEISMMDSNRGRYNYNPLGNNQVNKYLYDRLKRRIYREFPWNIIEYIKFNSQYLEFIYDFPISHKINYQYIE